MEKFKKKKTNNNTVLGKVYPGYLNIWMRK